MNRVIARHHAIMAVAGVVVTSVITMPSPAQALGNDAWLCGRDQPWIGLSQTGKANTKEATGINCGNVGVSVGYIVYQGSPTYWTSWKWSSTTVTTTVSNKVVSGAHRVTECGFYSCGPEYT